MRELDWTHLERPLKAEKTPVPQMAKGGGTSISGSKVGSSDPALIEAIELREGATQADTLGVSFEHDVA